MRPIVSLPNPARSKCMKTSSNTPSLSRRKFIQGSGTGLALFHIAPASVLGGPKHIAPNDKIQIAGIGVGSRGGADVNGMRKEAIVAIADVDHTYAGKILKGYPDAKAFTDYRKMLDEMDGSIDAVVIGTPDHTHSVIAMDAMKRKKHVYCEKPLCHSVNEVRALTKAAKASGVVTQLGNQGHSSEHIRRLQEWVHDGAIGKVTEVRAACNAFKHVYCQINKMDQLKNRPPVPEHLDYDLWLGPASYRAYSPLWVHWNWRGWMPFGTGCLGDWFCHVADPSYWALDLGLPESVHAEVEGYDPKIHADLYPAGVKITFQFPAKGKRGPVKFVWYDGNKGIERPPHLEEGRKVPGTGGVLIGENAGMTHGSHGASGARIFPETRMREYQANMAEKTIPRAPGGNHHQDFLHAIREGRKAGSDFAEYGGPLTECALVGAAAIRFPGQTLKYDAKKARFTNNDEANKLLAPPYREGWTLT